VFVDVSITAGAIEETDVGVGVWGEGLNEVWITRPPWLVMDGTNHGCREKKKEGNPG